MGCTDMIRQDGDEWICPDCGQSFGNRGICQHWTKSSYCDWPVPDADERDTMVGLYFGGGTTYVQSNGINMNLEKTSTNLDVMEWLQSELGFWATDIYVCNPATDRFEEFTGQEYDMDTSYRIRVRANPWVKTFVEADPVDVPMTTRSAAVLLAFKGHVADRSGVVLRSKRPRKLIRWLLGNGFTEVEITATESDRAYHKIYLTAVAARRFFSLIEDESVPGFGQKWEFEFREKGNQGAKPEYLLDE